MLTYDLFSYNSAWLEKEYEKKALAQERRTMSAILAQRQENLLKKQLESQRPASSFTTSSRTKVKFKDINLKENLSKNILHKGVVQKANNATLVQSNVQRYISACFAPPERIAEALKSDKKLHFKVFTPINIKEAPRMYYRPWSGDKLPVAERKERPASSNPPFKC